MIQAELLGVSRESVQRSSALEIMYTRDLMMNKLYLNNDRGDPRHIHMCNFDTFLRRVKRMRVRCCPAIDKRLLKSSPTLKPTFSHYLFIIEIDSLSFGIPMKPL